MARKRRRRTAWVASTLLAAGCGSTAERDPAAAVQSADLAGDAVRALARVALPHGRYVQKTLYTWTTREQIDELARTRQLLSREESPTLGGTYSEQVIHALAGAGDRIAKVVDTTTYAKSRFAWHAPWATRLGWPGEDYGDQLIRVTLSDRAIVLALSTATGAFEARDMQDHGVAADDVLAHPERIAAIYFVSDAGAPPAAHVPRPTTTYREYILINESMIESWAAGTDDIARELAKEASELDALARFLADRPPQPFAVSAGWAADPATPETAYAAALAFDNPKYRLTYKTVRRLTEILRSAPRPPAITGGGTAMFPGVGVARNPPRIVPAAPRGTYSTFAKP
jgi:hypothetical protein